MSTTEPWCFVTGVEGWREDNQVLYGGCGAVESWVGLVSSLDLPALFRRWRIDGDPPLLDPRGPASRNMMRVRVADLVQADAARGEPLPRWNAPREVDCTRKLGDACFTRDVDRAILAANKILAAGQRGANNSGGQRRLDFYWDAGRRAYYAVFEPADLYAYIVFYAGDYQVEVNTYDINRPWFGGLVDAVRRELPSLVTRSNERSSPGGMSDDAHG